VRRLGGTNRYIALRLASRIFSSYDYYWFKYWLPRSSVLVAEVNGEAVGFVEFTIRRTICGRTGIMMYVGVLPEYRGQGIGKILILSAEELLLRRGISTYMASTRSWNDHSIRLFKSLGYEIITVHDLYEKLGFYRAYELIASLHAYEDDIIMFKSISRDKCVLYRIL